MPKLGIGKLMQASGSCHAEVAPHILVAAEVQLLDCPGAWRKTLAPDRKEEMLLQVDSARQKDSTAFPKLPCALHMLTVVPTHTDNK